MSFSIQGMYDWAVQECQRTDVGYWDSYPERNQQTINGITYYDCSSFVFFACWLGGGWDPTPFGYSDNLADYHNGTANAMTVTPLLNALQATTGFQSFDPETEPWQAGDILIKARTHTEICYAPPSRTMGAHNRDRGVTINDFNTSLSYYDVLIRYTSQPGPTPPGPTLPLPIWLLKRAIENQKGGMTL